MCAALLTFVCMLRYSEWNVVPIWFLYSSVLMVVRCADLAPVLFNVYDGTLCRSTIWFWDSSVLMVVYCANLAPVLFNIYGGTLCRSGFWFLDSGFFDVSLMFASVLCSGFFPVGWKRQPEEGGIAPGCCGGGVITAWAAGDGVIAAGSAV